MQVWEHSSVERCGPHVAISLAMLRSSDVSRALQAAAHGAAARQRSQREPERECERERERERERASTQEDMSAFEAASPEQQDKERPVEQAARRSSTSVSTSSQRSRVPSAIELASMTDEELASLADEWADEQPGSASDAEARGSGAASVSALGAQQAGRKLSEPLSPSSAAVARREQRGTSGLKVR